MRRDALHVKQEYVTACSWDVDAAKAGNQEEKHYARNKNPPLTRTDAVDPGISIVLHPLHSVRFIDGSLGVPVSKPQAFEMDFNAHFDHRFLPDYFHRLDSVSRQNFRVHDAYGSLSLVRSGRLGRTRIGIWHFMEKCTGLIQEVQTLDDVSIRNACRVWYVVFRLFLAH